MLRSRYSTVSSKPVAMDDHSSLPPPTQNYTNPISSFLGSPRFLSGSLAKGHTDFDTLFSPTSILDSRKVSVLVNPFACINSNNPTMPHDVCKHTDERIDCQGFGVGLASIDSLKDEKPDDKPSKLHSKNVLFGSNLKTQIPQLSPSPVSKTETPKSPVDFGIKTRNSQTIIPPFPPSTLKVVVPDMRTEDSPAAAVPPNLSLSEMELCEEYTCVITRGPNPRITHIYDNCIVGFCCGAVNL